MVLLAKNVGIIIYGQMMKMMIVKKIMNMRVVEVLTLIWRKIKG